MTETDKQRYCKGTMLGRGRYMIFKGITERIREGKTSSGLLSKAIDEKGGINNAQQRIDVMAGRR